MKKGHVSVPPPVARPLVETNGTLAIELIEAQIAKLVALDPSDREAVEDAQRFLHGDVKRVFGAESEEYAQVWQNDMIPDGHLLNTNDEDDFDEGSWGRADKLVKRKAAIDKMIARVRRLGDRARELAAMHDSMKGNAMGLEDLVEKMGTPFTLVEQGNGARASYKGVRNTSRGTLQVHDPHFAGEAGDTIEFHPPSGKPEICEVISVSYEGAQLAPGLAFYTVKLRNVSARPQPVPVVHNSTTNYNIHGSTVGAVGENATVASSHVIGHATQWNGVDPKAMAGEIATLRKQIATAAGGDGADAEKASEDLVHVNEANKALAANNETGFRSAMKKLSAFGVKIVERVATAATIAYLQAHGVLPPPHAELPPPHGE